MSISQQFTPAHFTADGIQRQWPFTFEVPNDASVVGYLTSPTGVVSQITANMSVDLQNSKYIYPTIASGLAPLASGWKITLMRQTPCTQEIDLTEQDSVPYASMEEGLDKLTYLVQETQEELGRAVKFSCTVQNPTTDAQNYLNTVQGYASAASSSAQNAQDSALLAAQYAQNAQQDVSDLADDLDDLADTVRANQTADQTYANNVAANALTVSEAYCDAKIASEVTARQTADGTLQDHINAEASARQSADADLQTAINGKQAAGDYATNTALTTGLAAKQNVLSTAQQAAVDSGITSTATAQIQTNKEDIEALDSELHGWQKPSEWVDIRQGALPNSIYFLVGHSAPVYNSATQTYSVSTYPNFYIKARVNNSGTYDIYIDGIKVYAGITSDTTTTVDWAALYTAGTISGGVNVTYPTELVTHVVRLTPTVSTNQLNYPRIARGDNSSDRYGCLWAHFTTTYEVLIPNFNYGAYPAANYLLEAVTSSVEPLKVSYTGYAFYLSNLKTLPVLAPNTPSVDYSAMAGKTPLKKITFATTADYLRDMGIVDMSELEEVEDKNFKPWRKFYFQNCPKLKRIKVYLDFSTMENQANLFGGSTSLEPMVLDASEGVLLKRLGIGGTSSKPLTWLKGLIVSSGAPFNNATSPQLDVAYTGLNRTALVNLFNSLPTVSDGQVCNITGATGAADLTADDLAIATAKGWTVTR